MAFLSQAPMIFLAVYYTGDFMNKLILVLAATLISTSSFAGCLSTVKENIKATNALESRSIVLMTESSQILKPGESRFGYGDNYVNNTTADVEFFFVTESDDYYTTMSAVLVDPTTCATLSEQNLGMFRN